MPFLRKNFYYQNGPEKLRGKYNPTEKKRKYPNLQWAKLASGRRAKACVRCIKTQTKSKA